MLGPLPRIEDYRPMIHSDLPILKGLIRKETYDMFGDFELGSIYETSCLSCVQINEKLSAISGICLCNYPSVPSVASHDWTIWLNTLYGGVEYAREWNTLFIHFLVWDNRYADHFFEDLLTGLFDAASYLLHVFLVLPPRVVPADVFERQMIRILAKNATDDYTVQSLYVSVRHMNHSRLSIRRVVEEDNDEVIPIIDDQSGLIKDFYGEYYVSEIVRFPDDRRQFIVSEDEDGLTTGVMCLNKVIDVDILNENFELAPYNGLRKTHELDEIFTREIIPPSEVFRSLFARKLEEYKPSFRDLVVEESDEYSFEEEQEEILDSDDLADEKSLNIITDQSHKSNLHEVAMDVSIESIMSERLSFSEQFEAYYEAKTRESVFAEAVFDIPRTSVPMVGSSKIIPLEHLRHVLPHPKYYGEIDAFVLEIFAMHREIKTRWSRNFIEAAFECFPNLDYCAILLPFSHPFMPLLEQFVRVPLRCNKDFPMTLYVTHRAALHGAIRSRLAEIDDRKSLQTLVRGVPKMEKILADFDKSIENQSDLISYVFECNGNIVGAAILCAEENTTYLKRRYHVEDYICMQYIPVQAYGRVLHFVTMPIFAIHQATFFREIMRSSGWTVLFYRLYDSAMSALTRSHPLAICLKNMMMVSPRRKIDYSFRGYVETDKMDEDEELFTLFMTTPRLVSLPLSVIDMKIVVVGASDCGVALTEFIAMRSMKSNMHFTNLTLISPNGLPFERKHKKLVSKMIPFRGRYSYEYRHRLALRVKVNIVYGTVVGINRREKYVTVMNQGNIAYDYLVLTCGLQYQALKFIKTEEKGEETENNVKPWNCLTINDEMEAAECLEKIRILTNDLKEKKEIILYGQSISCYCALYGLLEFGVKGSWVTLIEPPLKICETHDYAVFNDQEVDIAILEGILKTGVSIILHTNINDWSLKDSPRGKLIEAVNIVSSSKSLMLECDVLLNFREKSINEDIFLAICRAGLVFDGQLVIDPEGRTNDPFILAAGTITKYARKFYADPWEHKYYNSVEVGERLGNILRSTVENQQRKTNRDDRPTVKVPLFRAPCIVACTFPGGYNYLHVRKPGKTVLRSIAIRHDFYGEVMVTGNCTSDIGYFRIRLNVYDTIETVTCFSKKIFETRQLMSLYGKHETMLNELKRRFQSSLITDFYSYFREPWATAIFYDRFQCLRVENTAIMLSRVALPDDSLIDDCLQALIATKWEDMSEENRRNILSRYIGSIYQHEIEENINDFLSFSQEDLPMYCTPKVFRELFSDIQQSPLFSGPEGSSEEIIF